MSASSSMNYTDSITYADIVSGRDISQTKNYTRLNAGLDMIREMGYIPMSYYYGDYNSDYGVFWCVYVSSNGADDITDQFWIPENGVLLAGPFPPS